MCVFIWTNMNIYLYIWLYKLYLILFMNFKKQLFCYFDMFPTVCHHSSFALLWNSQMCVCTQLSVTSCWWVPVCLCSEGGPGPQAGGAGVRSEHERRRSASQRQLRPHPPEQAGRLLPQGVSADRYRQTHARKLLERDRNVLILVYTSRGRFLHHLFPNTLLLSAVIPSHLLSLMALSCLTVYFSV